MFYNFSLCPGGAMMMCESVAEYDPTAAQVEQMEADANAPETPEEMIAQAEQVTPKANEAGADSCPVAMIVSKLEPLHEAANSLLTIQLNPESVQDLVANMDQLSEIASIMAESIRMLLVKQNAIYKYMSACDSAWAFESVHANLGFLVQNYKRIIRNGYNQMSVTIDTFPGLDKYNIERALRMYLKTDELPQLPFDIARLIEITSWEKNQDVFDSTEDMFKTFFHDPDRLARLTQQRISNYDLDSLMHRAAECHDCTVEPDDRCELTPLLIQRISKILRRVKQGCYEIQCDCLDNNDIGDHIAARVRPLISGTVDIFYLGALKLIAEAYEMKSIAETKKAVDSYIETVKNAMHSGTNL